MNGFCGGLTKLEWLLIGMVSNLYHWSGTLLI